MQSVFNAASAAARILRARKKGPGRDGALKTDGKKPSSAVMLGIGSDRLQGFGGEQRRCALVAVGAAQLSAAAWSTGGSDRDERCCPSPKSVKRGDPGLQLGRGIWRMSVNVIQAPSAAPATQDLIFNGAPYRHNLARTAAISEAHPIAICCWLDFGGDAEK